MKLVPFMGHTQHPQELAKILKPLRVYYINPETIATVYDIRGWEFPTEDAGRVRGNFCSVWFTSGQLLYLNCTPDQLETASR